MLERKRQAKQYAIVPGEEEHDLELGEGLGPQESGIVPSHTAPATMSLEAEVDNWDENAEDAWDEDQPDSPPGDGPKTPSASSAGDAEQPVKKRAD
jgi:hypothetical protein